MVSDTTDFISLINTQLMYYFRMNKKEVEKLTNREWAELWQHLQYIREKEANK